jgi:hypothetical protein
MQLPGYGFAGSFELRDAGNPGRERRKEVMQVALYVIAGMFGGAVLLGMVLFLMYLLRALNGIKDAVAVDNASVEELSSAVVELRSTVEGMAKAMNSLDQIHEDAKKIAMIVGSIPFDDLVEKFDGMAKALAIFNQAIFRDPSAAVKPPAAAEQYASPESSSVHSYSEEVAAYNEQAEILEKAGLKVDDRNAKVPPRDQARTAES